MDTIQTNEIKISYYEYIANVPQGLQNIINFLVGNEMEKALNGLANLAEGLSFLLKVEHALKQQNIIINSRITEAVSIYNEINDSLVNGDYIMLKDLIEYELLPIFSSASEWTFQEEVK